MVKIPYGAALAVDVAASGLGSGGQLIQQAVDSLRRGRRSRCWRCQTARDI